MSKSKKPLYISKKRLIKSILKEKDKVLHTGTKEWQYTMHGIRIALKCISNAYVFEPINGRCPYCGKQIENKEEDGI